MWRQLRNVQEKWCQFSEECKENKISELLEYTSGQITLFGLFFSELQDDIEISYAATGRRTGALSKPSLTWFAQFEPDRSLKSKS